MVLAYALALYCRRRRPAPSMRSYRAVGSKFRETVSHSIALSVQPAPQTIFKRTSSVRNISLRRHVDAKEESRRDLLAAVQGWCVRREERSDAEEAL